MSQESPAVPVVPATPTVVSVAENRSLPNANIAHERPALPQAPVVTEQATPQTRFATRSPEPATGSPQGARLEKHIEHVILKPATAPIRPPIAKMEVEQGSMSLQPVEIPPEIQRPAQETVNGVAILHASPPALPVKSVAVERRIETIVDWPRQLDSQQRNVVRHQVERVARERMTGDSRVAPAAPKNVEIRIDHVNVRIDAPAPAAHASIARTPVESAFGEHFLSRALR